MEFLGQLREKSDSFVEPDHSRLSRAEGKPLNLLLIEDSPSDARLVLEMLKESGDQEFKVTNASSIGAAKKLIGERDFDLIILDLSLPDSDGLDSVRIIRDLTLETPIIVFTGLENHEVGIEAIRLGVQDYFVKGYIGGQQLCRAISFALERARNRHERGLSRAAEAPATSLELPSPISSIRNYISEARRESRKFVVLLLKISEVNRGEEEPKEPSTESLPALHQAMCELLKEKLKGLEAEFSFDSSSFVCLAFFQELWQVVLFSDRVKELLYRPLKIGRDKYFVKTQAGIALFPSDGNSPEELLGKAQSVLKEGLESHSYRFASVVSHEIADTIKNCDARLREALKAGELAILFQPQVKASSGEVIGVEAVYRAKNPQDDLLASMEFVSLLNDSEVVAALDEYVLRSALNELSAHPELLNLHLLLKISAASLNSEKLISGFCSLIESSPFPPQNLRFEIPEEVLLKPSEISHSSIHRLKNAGAKICLGQFGAGDASLKTLESFADDYVVIDRSLIERITTDAAALALTRAIISMAHSMKLKVIAPGVETEEQLDGLRSLGCDIIQGYYIMKPTPLNVLQPILKTSSKLKPAMVESLEQAI